MRTNHTEVGAGASFQPRVPGHALLRAVGVAVAFVTVITGCCANAAAQAVGAVTPPPAMHNGQTAFTGERFFTSSDGLYSMRAFYDSETKSVAVTSYYLGGTAPAKSYSSHATRFWPTCMLKLGNGQLLVAGKGSRTGYTILEAWTFSSPSGGVIGAPVGSALVPGKLQDVREVLDETAEGRNLVQRMLPRFGGTGQHVLVQYYDSKDLYAMDVSSGAQTLIASPNVKPNSFHVPMLAEPDLVIWSRKRVGQGYWYGLQTRKALNPTAVAFAILVDDDRNGSIDAASTMTPAQWTGAGLDSPTSWEP